MVLNRYGIVLKKSGHELRGKCPIHGGSNNKHFTANTGKNVFRCFFAKCSARGNVLDFVAAKEHCSVREAAMKLKDWFKIGESQRLSEKIEEGRQVEKIQRGIYRDNKGALYELVTTATSAQDFETLVVYRELFGDYKFWVGRCNLFLSTESDQPPFLLMRAF